MSSLPSTTSSSPSTIQQPMAMASIVFSKADIETIILSLLDFSPDTPDKAKCFLLACKLDMALGSLAESSMDTEWVSFGIVPNSGEDGDDEGDAGNGVEGGEKRGVVPGAGGAGGEVFTLPHRY